MSHVGYALAWMRRATARLSLVMFFNRAPPPQNLFARRAFLRNRAVVTPRRFPRSCAVDEPFHPTEQMHRLVRRFGDYHIRAGSLFRKPKRIHKAGEQNDARVGLQLAHSLDQLASIHAWHTI